MSFKFITNSISTRSKVPTLSDIVKAAQTKAAMEKAASEAVHGQIKTASSAPVQPVSKEAGEKGKANAKNLTAPKFGPGGKAVKEEAAKPAAKPAAAKVAPKKAGVSNVKVAEEKEEGDSSGQLDVEPLHQEGESTQEKPGDLDTMKEKGEKVNAKSKRQVKVARFKKVAELTPKQKEFLRKVWSMYWPKKFIDAILSD